MRKIFLLFFSALMMFGGEIKIAVAANVSYAMDELVLEFNKKHKDVKVQPIFSSSGNLMAQIRNGAPFGLFLSANMKYPDKLFELGLTTSKPVVYAQGSLAVVTRRDYNLSKGIAFLTQKDVKSIAIANPDVAPYGKASVEAMEKANIYGKIKRKLIYGQSISQTLIFALSATDIGFVAKLSLFSPKLKNSTKNFRWIDVNPTLYTPIKQGIVILNAYKKDGDVKAFYDFILSKEAKEIFEKYGYLVNE